MERRNFLKSMLATSALAVIAPSIAIAEEAKKTKVVGEFAMPYADALKAITGDKVAVKSDLVELTVPEIAENGRVVPVKVYVNHPMENDNYIKGIHVLNSKNGNSRCANVHLTPMNGEAYFSTRIKLGGTQNVIALAETSKGEFLIVEKSVKVTIGGCG
jgi:sulfur-oxidizing protein SoxY